MARRYKVNPKILIFLMLFLVSAILFLPSTIVFFFGMMPSWATLASDRSYGKLKSLSVGMLNFAGVSYVLMLLWRKGHTVDVAIEVMMQAHNLIIMYLAAAIGFAVRSAMTGIVATILLEQTKARHKFVKKRLERLQERWGYEVTGKVPLDAYGFPVEDEGSALSRNTQGAEAGKPPKK